MQSVWEPKSNTKHAELQISQHSSEFLAHTHSYSPLAQGTRTLSFIVLGSTQDDGEDDDICSRLCYNIHTCR